MLRKLLGVIIVCLGVIWLLTPNQEYVGDIVEIADKSYMCWDDNTYHYSPTIQIQENMIEILKENGDYAWLTAKGSFVILQNGAEFVVTYIVLLLSLISFGPGKISLDHFILKNKA